MKFKFALWLAGIAAILLTFDIVLGLLLWSNMDSNEREIIGRLLINYAGAIVLLGSFAFVGLGLLLKIVFNAYVLTPKWIADETRIILSANPGHRIQPTGAAEIRELCETINSLADQYLSEKRDVEAKISEAGASLQDEKNRLAALMSQLALSVVVCDTEGRIILYNGAARKLLHQGEAGWIGLGRSVFGVLDRALIGHALDDIRHRLNEGDRQPVANMITTSGSGQLIRMQMAPVLSKIDGPVADRSGEISGFVLTLEDVTRSVETSNRRDVLLQSLTENTRAALANIRAAVENMLSYPEMKPERRAQFTGIIADEARKLSGQLDQTLSEYCEDIKTRLPIEANSGADLVTVIARRIESRLGISARVEESNPKLWLRVDSYSIAQAVGYLAARLHSEFKVRALHLALTEMGRLAKLEIRWADAALDSDTVNAWENDSLRDGGEESPFNLKQVLDRHDIQLLYQQNGGCRFQLLLPTAEPPAAPGKEAIYESRPEYYDFDLFNRPGQTSELDERRLTELTYTVFDTETTGLSPADGDEIISIGAVRIVNGRMLQHEVFDQLIDPKRSVPKKSTAVHGITPEMLRGQPAITEALPKFYRFCEDTVLVAHNAAFDMRFLQLKEDATGIKFTQPVLDTLLLSPVVHPFDPEHKLEAMAQRFGISVMGRHTALGDAFVTAEIFLRMIPVLAQKGIHTLKQARESSQKTLYAKVTY